MPAPAVVAGVRLTPLEERELVLKAQAGDEDAFAALVRWGGPTALGAARRVTQDAGLAEDAAQEAFLRAFRALGEYRHEASFKAWIRRIAIHAAIDIMRRRRPEVRLPEGAPAPHLEESRHEDADLLGRALASLSPLDRELILARELEGAPDREVARRFDMTVTGVRVRVHRARKKLRAAFRSASRR
jgi:RNA polymerase sigma-70 factor (ECF subfamily)